MTLPIISGAITAPVKTVNTSAQVAFSFFSGLPNEIQLQIWQLSLQSHSIEVHFSTDKNNPSHRFISITPSILHVNRQARAEGLRFYHLSRKTQHAPNHFYIYPALDILCFYDSSWNDLSSVEQMKTFHQENACEMLHKIQNVAIRLPFPQLLQYSSLRKVYIAMPPIIHGHGAHGDVVEPGCIVEYTAHGNAEWADKSSRSAKTSFEALWHLWNQDAKERGEKEIEVPELQCVSQCTRNVMLRLVKGEEEGSYEFYHGRRMAWD